MSNETGDKKRFGRKFDGLWVDAMWRTITDKNINHLECDSSEATHLNDNSLRYIKDDAGLMASIDKLFVINVVVLSLILSLIFFIVLISM